MDVGLDSVNLTQFRSLGVDDVAFLGKNRHELPGTNNKDYEFHNFGKFMILSEGVNTILRRMEDNFAAYYDLNIIFLKNFRILPQLGFSCLSLKDCLNDGILLRGGAVVEELPFIRTVNYHSEFGFPSAVAVRRNDVLTLRIHSNSASESVRDCHSITMTIFFRGIESTKKLKLSYSSFVNDLSIILLNEEEVHNPLKLMSIASYLKQIQESAYEP